ncbi:MAG TPA: sigma-70 family RNA polymerase sigma factor [Sphingomicrobium sp.]|nr:sigma-70 family RNA polymerase sigma factor [Sphingomicrobium sp.]
MNRAATELRGNDELAAVMGSVAGGDRGAFRILYQRTSAKLYGICLRLLGSEAEAQEVLQDAFVTVWRSAAQFDPAKASAITWLSVVARNKAIDRLRQRRPAGEDIDAAAEVPDDSPLATAVIEQEDDARRLAHCLEQLEDRSRAMIRAAFFDGASYPELAEREGVPLGTMKSWIRRGLLRLRGCLEQ